MQVKTRKWAWDEGEPEFTVGSAQNPLNYLGTSFKCQGCTLALSTSLQTQPVYIIYSLIPKSPITATVYNIYKEFHSNFLCVYFVFSSIPAGHSRLKMPGLIFCPSPALVVRQQLSLSRRHTYTHRHIRQETNPIHNSPELCLWPISVCYKSKYKSRCLKMVLFVGSAFKRV